MQPVQALFSASVTTIQPGQSATLNWQTSNASDVSIDNGVGEVAANGQKEVSPASNTTYLLTAKGSGGTQQRTISIVVEPRAAVAQQAAPVPAAPQVVDPSVAIQQAINSFDAAYNAHDIARIQASWTGIKPAQAKALQNFFKDQPTSKVSDSCAGSDLSVSGDTASWTCTETSTFVSGGRTQSHGQAIRFTFAKRGGSWTIVDRR
jgi:ketosteroid isomerase-like protein